VRIKKNMMICIGISLIFLLMVAGNAIASTGPVVDIEKYTLGTDGVWYDADTQAEGPEIPVDSTVEWRYNVTNTGILNLENVNVIDNQGVVPVREIDYIGNNDNILEPGEVWIYKANGTAKLGLYENLGLVHAESVFPGGGSFAPFLPVDDSDLSHYLGIEDVEIPEFPTIALPIMAILGLAFFFQRRRD